MHTLLQFGQQNIRMIMDAQENPWWIAQDICAALDITNVSQAVERLRPNEKGMCKLDTLGGGQQMLIVNEPGLYRLIFRSDKPGAEAFQDWVYTEVIPSLRRTGTYSTRERLPRATPPIKEHAEVSEHLLAVWGVLREVNEPLTNHEIAIRANAVPRTVRKHTQYLLQLGLLEMHELFPRHMYQIADQAEKRHPGYWLRLEKLAAIVADRKRRTRARLPVATWVQ